MADMPAALRARLVAEPALAALVGDRVAWLERPRGGGLPALTLQLLLPGRLYLLKGAQAQHGPRVQFDCWGESPMETGRVADAVTAALEPGAAVAGVRFVRGFVEALRDMPPEDMAGGGRVSRRLLEMTIWWEPEGS